MVFLVRTFSIYYKRKSFRKNNEKYEDVLYSLWKLKAEYWKLAQSKLFEIMIRPAFYAGQFRHGILISSPWTDEILF